VGGVAKHTCIHQPGDQCIVLLGAELSAPAGEAEVGKLKALVAALQGDRAGVAQPGIVVRQLDEADPGQIYACALQLRLHVGM
jgi:hypothetical protein